MDELVTTKLDDVDEFLVDLASDALAVFGLGEDRDDGRTRVAADDGNWDFVGVGVGEAYEEMQGTDDVDSGHTKGMGMVVDGDLLEHSGDDGDRTVEFTGLEMTRMWASGATRPTAVARSRTMEALV